MVILKSRTVISEEIHSGFKIQKFKKFKKKIRKYKNIKKNQNYSKKLYKLLFQLVALLTMVQQL
jgi:hypothetical protein